MRYVEPEPHESIGPVEMILGFITCLIVLGFIVKQLLN